MKGTFFSLSVLIFLFAAETLVAQTNNQFQIANRLMQQQRYDDALPILERLAEEQPEVFIFLERLVDCHIQLKDYDTALHILENSESTTINRGLSNILRGEVYHLRGDTAEAFTIWERNLILFPNEFQIYVNTASTMVERRAFEEAIEVFLQGRRHFNNPQLFITDIANVYMQAGRYQEAIAEWLYLIEQNPQQEASFKRLLLRYNDPLLFDDSIAEVEFKISEMNVTDPNYETFYRLQIWLQLENKLYRRAFATAREYERSTTSYNYALFNVGRQLSENNEFDLALQAFDFYKSVSSGEVRWRAYEEKAEVFMRWAKYLDNYSLDISNKRDSLYQLSLANIDTILAETGNYSRLSQVLMMKTELTLDYIFDLDEAKEVIARIKRLSGMEDTPEVNYLEGRIQLAQQEHTGARISFTRSNRQAGVGDLAEKTRYFLALNDFYAGDYEFAQIQLKTLGRQNTSYYANDALELRLWVQEGLASDTTGASLDSFAEAHFNYKNGNNKKAEELFYAIINSETPTPFIDDAYILLPKVTGSVSDSYFETISDYVEKTPYLPQREEFLWQLAISADELLNRYQNEPGELQLEGVSDMFVDLAIKYYENLILEFPQGFYAPFARQRLAELSRLNS
ncbi:MAG: tetratricopeptide repeat protein [Balneolales bacterium]|nr:tetratricopeptide repeat protein [Balneolales bacterium]